MANPLQARNVYGSTIPKQHFIGKNSEALKEGNPVKIDVGTGHIENVAADGTQMLGWFDAADATGDGSTTFPVSLAKPGVQFKMAITGTYAATELYKNAALGGSTGSFTVDLDDAGNDLFKIVEYDSSDGRCWVEVLPAASEAQGVEPI